MMLFCSGPVTNAENSLLQAAVDRHLQAFKQCCGVGYRRFAADICIRAGYGNQLQLLWKIDTEPVCAVAQHSRVRDDDEIVGHAVIGQCEAQIRTDASRFTGCHYYRAI